MAMQQVPKERPREKTGEGAEGNLVDRAWKVQHRLEARTKNLGKGKYGRVLKMARKPDSEEFNHVAKVTALGILILGALGFLIFFIMDPLLQLS